MDIQSPHLAAALLAVPAMQRAEAGPANNTNNSDDAEAPQAMNPPPCPTPEKPVSVAAHPNDEEEKEETASHDEFSDEVQINA